MNLLSFNKDEINAFMRETYNKLALRASKIKFLTSSKIISGPKSVLFELKDRDVYNALPSVEVLNSLDAVQASFMRKTLRQIYQDYPSREERNKICIGTHIHNFSSTGANFWESLKVEVSLYDDMKCFNFHTYWVESCIQLLQSTRASTTMKHHEYYIQSQSRYLSFERSGRRCSSSIYTTKSLTTQASGCVTDSSLIRKKTITKYS